MIESKIPRIHEPDYDDPKEPYAFFGLAAYYAQCFEQSIILLILALNALNAHKMKDTSYDGLLARLDKQTLGQLIRELNTKAKITPQFLAQMDGLLKQRNYLMHHYFERNSTKLMSERGRREMLDELRQIAQAFQDGDHALVRTYEPLWHKLGMTDEVMQRELERMKREAQ